MKTCTTYRVILLSVLVVILIVAGLVMWLMSPHVLEIPTRATTITFILHPQGTERREIAISPGSQVWREVTSWFEQHHDGWYATVPPGGRREFFIDTDIWFAEILDTGYVVFSYRVGGPFIWREFARQVSPENLGELKRLLVQEGVDSAR